MIIMLSQVADYTRVFGARNYGKGYRSCRKGIASGYNPFPPFLWNPAQSLWNFYETYKKLVLTETRLCDYQPFATFW